jgi:hypothetical protein
LCGREQEGLQLICKSLGRPQSSPTCQYVKSEAPLKAEHGLGSWIGEHRALLAVLAVGAVLFAVAVWWNTGRRPTIADAMSRANCQQLYAAARNRADSQRVDNQAARVHRERKTGNLRPDVRCGEIRYYDSLTRE